VLATLQQQPPALLNNNKNLTQMETWASNPKSDHELQTLKLILSSEP
jgi:hypothetical protein